MPIVKSVIDKKNKNDIDNENNDNDDNSIKKKAKVSALNNIHNVYDIDNIDNDNIKKKKLLISKKSYPLSSQQLLEPSSFSPSIERPLKESSTLSSIPLISKRISPSLRLSEIEYKIKNKPLSFGMPQKQKHQHHHQQEQEEQHHHQQQQHQLPQKIPPSSMVLPMTSVAGESEHRNSEMTSVAGEISEHRINENIRVKSYDQSAILCHNEYNSYTEDTNTRTAITGASENRLYSKKYPGVYEGEIRGRKCFQFCLSER
jgi:hypothetical protein